jgi:hypothetical protein
MLFCSPGKEHKDQLAPVKPQPGYFIEKQPCFCYAACNKPAAYNLLCSSGVSITNVIVNGGTQGDGPTVLFKE